ncbi:MAG TPA: chemotaxis protein CheW, partial [Polyangiaceae bacterium]|nr:chemotaxis protein CheW [Polyangiaceae bacterium]
MKAESQELSLLAQLRSEFDHEFAEPPRQERAESLEFLSFRAGGGNYAVTLGEVAAVQEIRSVTRVPGNRPGFDGLVTFQDQLVAVFSLAILIAAPQPSTDCRWLLVCRADRQVGFSVDGIDGYQRASISEVIKADQ